MSITSKRPYLIRAMHEWMLDNGFTPHIVVDAAREDLVVPKDHVTDGKIVLNVSMSATRALALGNEAISFEARFGGVARQLEIPVDAVLGIYARETGQGMIFTEEDPPGPGPDGSRDSGTTAGTARPSLKVVK